MASWVPCESHSPGPLKRRPTAVHKAIATQGLRAPSGDPQDLGWDLSKPLFLAGSPSTSDNASTDQARHLHFPPPPLTGPPNPRIKPPGSRRAGDPGFLCPASGHGGRRPGCPWRGPGPGRVQASRKGRAQPLRCGKGRVPGCTALGLPPCCPQGRTRVSWALVLPRPPRVAPLASGGAPWAGIWGGGWRPLALVVCLPDLSGEPQRV